MGEQIRIVDLARDLIRLSGFEPGKDIEIVFSGIRDGEKLSEDLWNDGRTLNPTEHPAISSEQSDLVLQGEALEHIVDSLVALALDGEADQIIELINQRVPEAEIKHPAGRKK